MSIVVAVACAIPMEAAKAISTKIGSVKMRQLGTNWYQIIRPIRIKPEIRKSTKLVITELAGIMRRGK